MRVSRGFTIIELLIVVTLIGLVFGGSIAGYTRFNDRQIVLTAGKELVVNMRQAQARATSGVKTPAGCTTLRGYRITAVAGGTSYTLSSVCSNNTFLIRTYTLPTGVTFQAAYTITFQGQLAGVQGVANNGTNVIIQTSALTYTINVNPSGGITDIGLN